MATAAVRIEDLTPDNVTEEQIEELVPAGQDPLKARAQTWMVLVLKGMVPEMEATRTQCNATEFNLAAEEARLKEVEAALVGYADRVQQVLDKAEAWERAHTPTVTP